MVLGQVRENFSVQFNIFLLQGIYELAVFYSVLLGRGAQLDLPEPAVVALLFFTALEHPRESVEQSLLGRPFFGFAAPAIALRELQYLFLFYGRRCPVLP